MPSNLKTLESKLTEEIHNVAIAMSKTTGELEAKVAEIQNEHMILMNKYSNVSSRLDYLEKQFLKK